MTDQFGGIPLDQQKDQFGGVLVDPSQPSTQAASDKPVGMLGAAARGFKRSLPETKSLLYGALAAGAGLTGADGVRDWALGHYKDIQQNEIDPLANQHGIVDTVHGKGSIGEYVGDTLGNFAGQGLQSAAVALAGAAAGSEVPIFGNVAGAVGGLLAKKTVEGAIKKKVASMLEQGIAKDVAEKTANEAGQKMLRRVGAGTLAQTGMNVGQEVGTAYTGRADDAADAGQQLNQGDAARAILAGIPAGLLDTVAEDVLGIRALHGVSGNKDIRKRIAAGIAQGMLTEGSTEAAQGFLERLGAGQSLGDKAAVLDYIENAAAGALGGGAFGAAGGIRRNTEHDQGKQGETQETPPPVLGLPAPDGTPGYGAHIVTPQGTVITPEDQSRLGTAFEQDRLDRQGADVQSVQDRNAVGLTPDVNVARAAHPAATPNVLMDGSPVPNAANGPLSRAVSAGVESGVVPTAQPDVVAQVHAEAAHAAATAAGDEVLAPTASTTVSEGGAPETGARSPMPRPPLNMDPDTGELIQHDPAQVTQYLAAQGVKGMPSLATISKTYGFDNDTARSVRKAALDVAKAAPAPTAQKAAIDTNETAANMAMQSAAQQAQAGHQEVTSAHQQDGKNPGIDERGGLGTTHAPDEIPNALSVYGERPSDTAVQLPEKPAVDVAPTAVRVEPVAENVAPAYDDSSDVLDGDITPPSGGAFENKGAADLAARRAGVDAKVVEVGGGWVVRQPVQAAQESPVTAAATEAATSPTNALPEPTEAQKEAGNYKKGHVKIGGLDISIENPAGSQRRPEWPPLANHYGYIKGSIGKDKDHVDVFIADGADDTSRPVYVVDQYDPKTGKFDEHKVVLGATNEDEARAIYRANYSADWAGDKGIREFSHDEFKQWVQNPNETKRPASAEDKATAIDATEAPPTERASTVAKDAPSLIASQNDLFERLRSAEATLAEYKVGWKALQDNREAVLAHLNTLKKYELVNLAGPRYKSENKAAAAIGALHALEGRYTIGRGLSYSMDFGASGKDTRRLAMENQVNHTTDEDLATFNKDVANARKERQQRVDGAKNPQTLSEFSDAVRMLGSEKELTDEQRERYDALRADARREQRDAEAKRNATIQQVQTGDAGMTLVETKHTQKGHDLFVVKMDARVERDVYDRLNSAAKRLGGSYSSFRGNGAVPGFQFRTKEAAEQFMALQSGNVDASGQQQVRAESKAENRAETLAEKAATLRERAEESLGRDRKDNTARRAAQAASAEAEARKNIALADTMDRIAKAIESGTTRMLSFVRHRSQVEMLENQLKALHWDALRNRGMDWEKAQDAPITAADIVAGGLPEFHLPRGDAAVLARKLSAVRGGKQLGVSLAGHIDYGDEYVKAVKENPLRFALGRSDGGLPMFDTRREADAAIARSGAGVNGIAVKVDGLGVKKATWLAVRSPESAIERKLWAPDYDKKLAINPAAAEKILGLLGTGGDSPVPYWWKSHLDTRKQFAKLGIDKNFEFREAMREYLSLRKAPAGEDRVRKLERDLVGRKDVGNDFFPTPPAVVDRLVEQANIGPGMRVLEPSAGKGDIAVALRDAAEGVQVDTGEMSSTLRDILEARGFDAKEGDFLDHPAEPTYDRIVMNPPFGNDSGAAHVRHAYDMMKPGGRLVAVMGEGQRGKADFDAWLESKGGLAEPLPEGSFKSSFRPTGVATKVVVIDKPHVEPVFSRNDARRLGASGIPEWLPLERDNADAKRLTERLARFGRVPPEFAALRRDSLPYALRYALATFERFTGNRVVVVRNLNAAESGLRFNGVTYRDGVLYVDEKATSPITTIAGHEFVHNLRRDNPELYALLHAEVQRQGRIPDYQNNLNERDRAMGGKGELSLDKATEELAADAVGDALTDPEFLNQMAQRNPTKFQRIAAAFMRFLDSLLGQARDLKSNKYLSDVKALRDVLADVLDRYSPADSVNTEESPTFSRSIDGRGTSTIEHNGETFAERSGTYYLADPKGEPRDFHRADAEHMAKLSGGVAMKDDNAPTWSVVLPDHVVREQEAMGPMFSRADAQASLGESLSNTMNNARDVRLPAGYILGDLLSHGKDGTLNWWHKSVGTMFNLAKKNPLFRRVYDSVQRQISDTSHYANAAMDLAPNLLPKFDSYKDFGKSPISGTDSKKVSDAVFDGTLRYMRDENRAIVPATTVDDAGVRWTDDELRSRYGMNDAQIGYYREARNAIDRSLDDAAVSSIVRLTDGDTFGVRDQALAAGTARKAAIVIRDHLMDQAKEDPKRAGMLNESARQVMAMADQVERLQERGYAPLSRFGEHTVYVTGDGIEPVFQMFESKAEANRAARALARAHPTANVERGTLSDQQFQQFRGMTPETLELFGDILGLSTTGDEAKDQAFQAFLQAAKANRSAMKRLIHREGIEGFSTDIPRVLANFIYSNARLTATNLNSPETARAIAAIPKEQGQLKDAAINLDGYVTNPQESAAKIGAFNFAQYLGGSIASAMVNMTQPLTMSFPWLSQYGGAWGAAKALKDAGVQAASNKPTGDVRLDEALKRAAADGVTQPQEVHQLQAYASGKGTLRAGDGTKAGDAAAKAQNAWARTMLAWGVPFALAEQFNRKMTFIAAFNMARDQGMADPYGFATEAVNTTQGVYNKANKPAWARSTLGGMAFTFKQYSINYVEMLHRMWNQGVPGSPERRAGRTGVLHAMVVMALLSGASGLPGADDFDDLLDGLMQRLGFNFNTKQAREQFFAKIVGESGAKFLEHGMSAIPGMPIDVSGRLGMGNLIPATGLLTKKKDHTSDVLELAGPSGDFASRTFQAADALTSGDIGAASKAIIPRALANAWQGIDMVRKGYYADSKGRRVLPTDAFDAASKLIGFQPANVAKVQQASSAAQQMVDFNRLKESEIADMFAQASISHDPGDLEDARNALRTWNSRNPETPIQISPSQIRSRVKNMQETKQERLSKAAPKELREQVRQTLAGSGKG